MNKILSRLTSLRTLLCVPAVLSLFAFTPAAQAQDGYEAFSVLGTSQALCKPGIESGDQLQAFFQNNPALVNQVLSDANWQGNPQDLFDAIAAGEFTENLYERGSKFEWTSFQEKGVGMSKPRRIWAGDEPFRGFEVNITSNCRVHTMVIPHACCNLSLASSTEVAIVEPRVTINADFQEATICASDADEVVITQADGTRKTVSLDGNGCWTGTLAAGVIGVTATNNNECGVASGQATYEIAAAPVPEVFEPEPVAKASILPYVGAFVGDERRMRYEPDWDMFMEDDSDLVGVFAGLMKPLDDARNWMLFGQIGYADRDGVSDRLLAPDDTVFLDIGIDRYFGPAFIGGGIGIWDAFEDDDFRDGSLFVHAGSYLGQSGFQLYVEGRAFTDDTDIDTDRVVSGGLRYIFNRD